MRIHRSRGHYWSCTEFANWIRRTFGGLEKPRAATMGEWQQYHTDAKAKNAFVDWLCGRGLNGLQDILCFPFDVFNTMRIYIVNRFVDRTHLLPTRLTPGEYYDVDTKLFHAMFEALVDFIEIEKAWMEVVFNDEMWRERKYPWWHRYRLLRWTRQRRCPEAGLAYLAWEMSLTGPDQKQADAAAEQLALYNWWKFLRPTRGDPYDIEGMTFEQRMKVEAQYDQEDEEMLIRLIKIRRSLWT